MKFFGIVLIFISVSLIGFEIGNKYLSELGGIKRAEIFLKNIILCLESENLTLTEIFENCKKSGDKKTEDFIFLLFKNGMSDIEQNAAESGFCTNKSALSVLQETFFVLGKYSSENQIREISFCRNRLNDLYAQNEVLLKSKSKLIRISGILAGAFISILFF
ncbi:MAG: hypothetical protein E7479_00920 [Ruminococcaceae bacterium]|nr:hypothetical protein [Oscillospiraceae bacterium]